MQSLSGVALLPVIVPPIADRDGHLHRGRRRPPRSCRRPLLLDAIGQGAGVGPGKRCLVRPLRRQHQRRQRAPDLATHDTGEAQAQGPDLPRAELRPRRQQHSAEEDLCPVRRGLHRRRDRARRCGVPVVDGCGQAAGQSAGGPVLRLRHDPLRSRPGRSLTRQPLPPPLVSTRFSTSTGVPLPQLMPSRARVRPLTKRTSSTPPSTEVSSST